MDFFNLLALAVSLPLMAIHFKSLGGFGLAKVEAIKTTAFVSGNHTGQGRRFSLGAVPKKKPSTRRTRIRRTAWMKRFPKYYKKPMMLDMYDVTKYTDGTLTKSRTTHFGIFNLPNTSLDGNHFLTREYRPTW